MNGRSPGRRPHAILDLPSRRLKALKIERLLSLERYRSPFSLLEIGTGSGGIAHYFATHETLDCQVTAVDVIDQRSVRQGYDFLTVDGTDLPFSAHRFDVVLSNHVIEHVGDAVAQNHHLREMRRVMKQDGLGYLAVPNRWQLVEPHYRLPFLSWLPRRIRSPYLRLCRHVKHYDCEPLTQFALETLLDDAGFSYRNLCVEAFRETLHIENSHGLLTAFAARLPDTVLGAMTGIIPTLIYELTHETVAHRLP